MPKNVDKDDCSQSDDERLGLSLNLVDANIMVCDNELNIVYANSKVLQMFLESENRIAADYPGFRTDRLIGTNLNHYHAHPDRAEGVLTHLNDTHTTNIIFGGETYQIVINPVVTANGERLGSVVEWKNLTAEEVREEEEQRRREQLERILDGLGDLRVAVDATGIISDVNRETADRLGYRRDDLVGSSIEKLLPDGITVRTFGELAIGGVVQDMRTKLRHADGHTIPVTLFGLFDNSITADSNRSQVLLLGRCTESYRNQSNTLNLSNYLADRISDGVAVVDGNGYSLSANRSFCQIIDVQSEQLIGVPLSEAMPGIGDFSSRSSDATWQQEYEGKRRDNSDYTVVLNVHALGSDDGEQGRNRLVTIRDVTTIRKSERQLHDLAYFDTLTGLANRAYFKQQVRQSIKMAQRKGQRFALLFFDLDGFKDVNDSLGHAAGDELLRVIAKRIGRNVRDSDLVARLGGDEFCVLLEDIQSADNALLVANNCLRSISESYEMSGRELQPMASIGITLFPDDGKTYADLLRAADTAMYVAKSNGKNRCAFYSPEMTLAAQERLQIEHELRAALRNNEFVVHYQPQVSLHSGRVTGVEALVRWNHPKRGMLAPNYFIPVLERLRLIEDLGVLVLEVACQQIKTWQEMGVGDMLVGINISSLHFQSGRIVGHIHSIIESLGIDPRLIELEVTESVIQTGNQILETCEALKKIGVKLSLDDFGTGFSCLDSMRRLPLDRIKIDRLFIRDLMEEPSNASIVATIIAMSRAMGMDIVAEGVEELRQVQYLSGLGCNTAQGFYFSRPVCAADIPAIVARTFLPTGRRPKRDAAGQRNV